MSLDALIRGAERSAELEPSSFAGSLASDAVTVDDTVMVILDRDPLHQIGPCKWNRQGPALPERGDSCQVVFDEIGTPWISVWWATAGHSGPRELGYAQRTSDFSAGGFADVTDLTVTATTAARKIIVELFSPYFYNDTVATDTYLNISEDDVTVAFGAFKQPTTATRVPIFVMARRAPAAGSHTYKATVYSGAGTAVVGGQANAPSFIRVSEIETA